MKNKAYAKFWRANKVRYSRCASGVYLIFDMHSANLEPVGLIPGGRTPIYVLHVEAPLRAPTLTLLYTIFERKGNPFVPSTHKRYPFQIPSLELNLHPFKPL